MLDPLDVRLEVAQDDAAERHRVADGRRLIARRLFDDRRVWKHRCRTVHRVKRRHVSVVATPPPSLK